MKGSNTEGKMTGLPSVLYEDNHLIAVNKRVSDLVQGDVTGDLSLDTILKQYIKEKYGKPGRVFLGVVHRLDRPVSGVTVFAKTSKSLSRMNDLFREGKVKKIYWAITAKPPPSESGVLTHFLKKNPRLNKSYAYEKPLAGSKEAKLAYRITGRIEKYYLLEIDLMTGRHHQIRSQLSITGCPVKGDLKYGFPRSNPDGGISLHARELQFEHPVRNEPLRIVAPVPEDKIWGYFSGIDSPL